MGFKEELRALLNREIVVISNDGMIHRGKLVRFDKEVLVLRDIYETANREIEWVETKNDKGGEAQVRGFIRWRKVLHPLVIIRLPMVLRIWPWVTIRPRGRPRGEAGGPKSMF